MSEESSNPGEMTAELALRREVRAWLAENWSKDVDPKRWRMTVVDSGWAYATWPTQYYGRAVPPGQAAAIEAEFAEVGATSPGFGPGLDVFAFFMGSAILAHGSERMKRGLLGQLLRGELGQGCLLYSEPGAGSDLGGLQTRADRDGDEYVVNGQKIWSSLAASADWGLLIARTDWDVPKHQGISFFLLPMKIEGELQRGIEIRPIRQITGEQQFNEVFFTDARVPAANLVGDENSGWAVLQTALTAERVRMGGKRTERPTSNSVIQGSSDLVEAARVANKNGDPAIRRLITQIHMWRQVQRWTAERAAEELRDGGSSPLASLGKLANSRILHSTGSVLRLIDGPAALLYDYDHVDKSSSSYRAMAAFVNSIGGGSDQIQRNIIGERILGLPKTPDPDRGIPFRDARKSAATRRFSPANESMNNGDPR